ncbi:hypothetical protein F5Y16DRAFT_386585 [Xylariaceae sp. FL0255]|nr:hypothetical protein F5Y16DRAFT_386585 [Xylariaceae sp. FL0255]
MQIGFFGLFLATLWVYVMQGEAVYILLWYSEIGVSIQYNFQISVYVKGLHLIGVNLFEKLSLRVLGYPFGDENVVGWFLVILDLRRIHMPEKSDQNRNK